MADNRDFVQGFMNEGGSPVYVEDKKLSEISTKSTVASEGVMLKGTDGAYYSIDKASLSEVIRAELGAILADNSKNNGTSVGKVPTLNSSGNDLGASSVADLASVLGVGFSKAATVITSTTDIDDLVTAGNFYAWGSDYPSGTFPSDISDKRYFTLKIVDQNLPTQILTNATNGRVWQRVQNNGVWSSWYSSDSFGCSTPSALASLLGAILQRASPSQFNSIDDVLGNYIMTLTGQSSWGAPILYGALLSFQTYTYTFHLAFPHKDYITDGVKYRMGNGDTWSEWKTIALT